MNSEGVNSRRSTRSSKEFAGRQRVGRYARNQIQRRVTKYVSENWPVLLVALVLPGLIYLPFYFWIHGSGRWIILGAAGVSGPWTVAMMTILLSGVADSLMGLDAEGATADEIRKLRRKGWRLVNGMKIKGNEDIDHLVVCPAGVLVVESKWSRSRWPIVGGDDRYMNGQLASAVDQVLRNRKNVITQFGGVLKDVPIKAICVVWSAENSSMDPAWIETQSGVFVVRGPAFRDWLKTQSDDVLDGAVMNLIWSKFEGQATLRDDADAKRFGAPRLTAGRIVLNNFFMPFLGMAIVVYGMAALSLAHSAWLDVVSAGAFFAFGVIAVKLQSLKANLLRSIAIGIVVISGIYLVLYVVIVIRAVA